MVAIVHCSQEQRPWIYAVVSSLIRTHVTAPYLFSFYNNSIFNSVSQFDERMVLFLFQQEGKDLLEQNSFPPYIGRKFIFIPMSCQIT